MERERKKVREGGRKCPEDLKRQKDSPGDLQQQHFTFPKEKHNVISYQWKHCLKKHLTDNNLLNLLVKSNFFH